MTFDKLLTPKQVAERLNINELTLANSRSTGTGIVIDFVRISGKAIRYKESDIDIYIESHTYSHNGEVKTKENAS
jgi:BioD-like phosphotransacetylase family protein